MFIVLQIIAVVGGYTLLSLIIEGNIAFNVIARFFPQYEELIESLRLSFPRVTRFWNSLHKNCKRGDPEPITTLPFTLLFIDLWPVWVPLFFLWLAYHTFMRWRVGRRELARRLAVRQKKAEFEERIRAQESSSTKARREIAKIESRESQLRRELEELEATKHAVRLRIAPDTYREAVIDELAEDEAAEEELIAAKNRL